MLASAHPKAHQPPCASIGLCAKAGLKASWELEPIVPQIDLSPDDYLPAPPPPDIVERYGIAIVGCGGVAQGAHLPAYRQFGYRVVAACDIVEEKASQAASEFAIHFWSTNIEDVLERDEVDIVDLAVAPAQRLELVEKIAAAGKHVLSQKPLAESLADAERIVDVCREAGVTLMVNQQARWAPYHRAMKVLIDRGVFGHLYSVVHVHRQFQDNPGSPWLTFPDETIVENGIHYVDLARYFTGRTPVRVKATTTFVPGQHARDPMIYSILCEYEPNDLMTTLHFNNIATGLHHSPYLWYVDGTEASASIVRYGAMSRAPAQLTVSLNGKRDHKQVIDIQGLWQPEAWGGSMGEMLMALAHGREPECSGRDNLNSVRMTHAAVESSRSGGTIEIPSAMRD